MPATRTSAVGFPLPPGCSAPATKRWPPGRTCTSEARSVEIQTPGPPALATRSIWPSPPGCVTSSAGADAWRSAHGDRRVQCHDRRVKGVCRSTRRPEQPRGKGRERGVRLVEVVERAVPDGHGAQVGPHCWDISSASAADPVEASKSGPDAATTPMTNATPMMTSATAGSRNASVGARVHGAVRSSECEPDCIGGTCRL